MKKKEVVKGELNVGLVTPYFDPTLASGIGGFEYHLCRGLIKLGHNVTVYTSNKSAPPAFARRTFNTGTYKEDGLTVKRYKILLEPKARNSGFPILPGVFSALLRDDIDVINACSHEQPLTFGAFIIAWKRRIPFTFIHWGYDYPPGITGYILFSAERTILQPLFLFTKKIIAGAEVSRKFLIKMLGVPEKRVALVKHDSPDTDLFNPQKIHRTEARRYLNLKDEWVILSIAKLYKAKGLDYLIKAFASIKNKLPEEKFKVVILGIGPEKDNLEKLAQKLGVSKDLLLLDIKVDHKDMPKIYAAANVFVLPTLSQQGSLVINEALLMKLPVIATRIGAIPKIIRENETGVLVPPANSEALAEAILRIHDNPNFSKRIGIKGRKFTEKNYNYLQMARDTLKVYNELINKGPNPPL